MIQLFGETEYTKIEKPLIENDLFGNWNYYSLDNKNKEENIFFNEKKNDFHYHYISIEVEKIVMY